MQETALIILQDSLEYPCQGICSNQPTFKRFKVFHNSQENCQVNFTTKVGLKKVGLVQPTTHFHARKTKPANVMKFKNIFGMSSASSTSSKPAASQQQQQQQQQTNIRKGKKSVNNSISSLKHNHYIIKQDRYGPVSRLL